MIKEVMEERIGQNMDAFLIEIVRYFGTKYSKQIDKKINNTHIAVIRNSGVVDFGNDQIYIEEEPICAKYDDHSYIFIPVTLMKEDTGNIIFIHQLLHAIVDSGFERENDLFNEILIDYIANDIGANLEKENVNFTFNKNPIYKSKSFYSKFFPIIKEFYNNNKEDIIRLYMGDMKAMDFDVRDIIDSVEDSFNKIMFEEENEVKDKLIKK